jgi:hypothetical protein
MKLIDGPGAGPGNTWTGGNPALAIPATQLRADWFNVVQAELAAICGAAGITLDQSGVDTTQLLQALGLLTGARPGLLNQFINGDFRVWQRDGTGAGVSVAFLAAAGKKYTADRWWGNADGNTSGTGQMTCARIDHTVGQSVVPGNPTHFLRITQASASSVGPPIYGQNIEDVVQFSGRQITISVWLIGAAAFDVSCLVTQKFGSGGSADVAAGAQVFNVTTSWTKHTFTLTVPSISGKTLGPGHNLQVHLQLPQGTTFQLDVSDFQCEPGATASPYDRRQPEIELALCKRYYQKSWAADVPLRSVTAPNIEGGSSVCAVQNNTTITDRIWGLNTRFPVEMRTTPTIPWYDVAGAATANRVTIYTGAGPTSYIVSATLNTTPNASGYPTTDFVGGSGAYICQAQWQADAEF